MEVSPRRLAVAIALIFLLGVLFAIVNGYYTEEEDSALPIIVYGISLLSLVIGGIIILLFQWKISKMQMTRGLKGLPSEERLLVTLLFENGNSMEQNKLVALSGFNRVKISRLVSALEKRRAVRKTDLGNTNLIVLDI